MRLIINRLYWEVLLSSPADKNHNIDEATICITIRNSMTANGKLIPTVSEH